MAEFRSREALERENRTLRKEVADCREALADGREVRNRFWLIADLLPARPCKWPQNIDFVEAWVAKHVKRDKKRAKKKAARREYHICKTCARWCTFPACGGVSLDREPNYACKNWVSRDD